MFERNDRVYVQQEWYSFYATVFEVFDEAKKLLVIMDDGNFLVVHFHEAEKVRMYAARKDINEKK